MASKLAQFHETVKIYPNKCRPDAFATEPGSGHANTRRMGANGGHSGFFTHLWHLADEVFRGRHLSYRWSDDSLHGHWGGPDDL